MTANDLDLFDQVLSSDDVLIPSSGFAAGVMEAVREAAGEPPPLPFPWRRFVAGLLGCSVWSISAVALGKRIDWSVLSQAAAHLGGVAPELGYAAAVMALSLGFLRLQRTFARD